MKKLLLSLAVLVLVPCLAHAQIIDWNGNVVAGAAIDTAGTPVGNRVDFLLSLNLTGFRIANNLYFAGVGADAGTVQSVIGPVTTLGLAVTVPVATYYPKGGQFLIQAGLSQAILGEGDKPFRVYVAGGWGFTSPQRIAYKREVKAAKKAGKAAPPCPPSVCPVAK